MSTTPGTQPDPNTPQFVQPPAPAPAPPAPAPAPQPQQLTRPDGVSEEEWNDLREPGKRAIIRERERAATAERALAARTPTPAPPKTDPPKEPAKSDPPKLGDGQQDIAAIVAQAVSAAMAPLIARDEQRETTAAVTKLTDTVLEAAKLKLTDPTDALSNIDLGQVTDGNGGPDAAKITAELDALIVRKPHLAKVVDTRPFAPPGAGAGQANPSLDARVKSTVADMRASQGLPPLKND